MARKLKQHEKPKFATGVYGPDSKFYKTGGSQGEVELRLCYNEKGHKRGMYWCHRTSDLRWPKSKDDEIRKEI